MNQNLLIGLVILLILAGVGWYIVSKEDLMSGESATSTPTTENSNTTAANSNSGSGNLQSVFSRSGNYTCSFTMSNPATPGDSFSGTVFGTGSQTRADFRVQVSSGTVIESHMIRTGGYTYTWVDGNVKGTKSTAPPTNIPAVTTGGYIANNGTASWDCHPWVPESAKFTLPNGISFVGQ
ncbi:MAG: hypothetical protein A2849_01630 [Candidatus Taylorbacteria bacterium RIFCSPHIGHO2_01_FULL_51_15]|uniref:Uncharacterized protein n=1 Tax=Candidatus Taylorbacteria bacterium RIFCSPHIGHO2_01_FULL_51_15 TaxID=1802304 RepID=A0A1G2M9Z9_9BACT|nr:MAG: hypothetical protein A2849_01630 [Candidatus Taylorbacteria bacterium RIFCSPHIGHO2_01_FULL_51_15]